MPLRRYSRYIKPAFFLWDIVLLNTAFLIALHLRYHGLKEFDIYYGIILRNSNFVWIFLVLISDAYKFIRVEPIEKIILRSIKLTLYHSAIIFAFIVLMKYDVSRLVLFYFYIILCAGIICFRIFFIHNLKVLRKKGYNYRNVFIVGSGNTALELYQYMTHELDLGYRLLGYYDESPSPSFTEKLKYIPSIDEMKTFLIESSVHEIYIALSEYNSKDIKEIIDFCESNMIRIKLVPNIGKLTRNRNISIDFYGYTPIIALHKEPLEKYYNRIVKNFFDIIFSLLIIILLFSWLFPIIAILIKLSSKGPVFFRQSRSGESSDTFTCWKFRSMVINKEADTLQADKNDSRITGIGKILRRYNLDELPQFVNVLIGNMSVVGPRPHMVKHTEEYSQLIKNYQVRHYIKPGITGWAQVNGLRGETKRLELMQKRIEHDIWYVENWSFFLDLKIVILTVINMFRGEENAG